MWRKPSYLPTKIFAHYPIAEIICRNQVKITAPMVSIHYQACYQQQLTPGVIHINVPFAEPLYQANLQQIDNHSWLQPLSSWLHSQNRG